MQPFQRASEEIRRQGEIPVTALKTAASTIGGGIAVNKVLPFLNQYLPENLAIKGLTKVDPRFGKFIKRAMDNGYGYEELRNFIGEKTEEGQSKPSKETRNIIEQYSPELHQFIDQEIKKGRNVLQAGALAQNDKRFSKIIQKLSKDHKTPWSNILQSVYGEAQQGQQQAQPQQQTGQGQQALASILDRINQRLG